MRRAFPPSQDPGLNLEGAEGFLIRTLERPDQAAIFLFFFLISHLCEQVREEKVGIVPQNGEVGLLLGIRKIPHRGV